MTADEGGVQQTKATSSPTRFGPYDVFERLGQGGMCLVFRARRDGSPRDCALKVLRSDRRSNEQMKDLFITEADLALLVEHPNLIHAYEAGEVDGRYYIAMELIEGGTLQQLLKVAASRDIGIPPDVALFIVSEVLEGLHALHETRGASGRALELVHRDVTPQNVFLSYDGRIILGDLGVTMIRAYGDADPSQVLGKLGYLAPEMIRMEDVDRRADLFAVGVVAYELLTESRLFHGKSEDEIMEQIADARLPRPRKRNANLSLELDSVIMRALSRRPEDRFQTAEAMLYALEPLWSKKLADPFVVAALLAGLHPPEAARSD